MDDFLLNVNNELLVRLLCDRIPHKRTSKKIIIWENKENRECKFQLLLLL